MTMFAIRRAEVQDVADMHELQQRAFQEEARRCNKPDIPPLVESPASIEEHVRNQVALIATMDQRAVGCVRGVIEHGVCTVRALVVDPLLQGHGIGGRLLAALELEARDVRRIDLTTNTIMEANAPFYERRGYKVLSYTEPAPGVRLAHMSKTVASAALYLPPDHPEK